MSTTPPEQLDPRSVTAAPGRLSAPVAPHQHRDGHDPAAWDPTCCACQNRGHRPDRRDLFVDEACPTCLAQRDQDRPYVVLEWAVRHPNGVMEENVPEALAVRSVRNRPELTLLRLERIVTPDVVSEYEVVQLGHPS